MRRISALVGAMTLMTLSPLVAQTGSRGAPPTPAVSACSLLTKDVLMAHSPRSKENLTAVLSVPPQEDKVGGGTACSYGGVTLQVDVISAATIDKLAGEWKSVSGVGDKAAFRDNKGRFAELGVRAGSRTLTIQMSVPSGRTAASIEENAVALAKALLPKLK